jgi:hypothetical protein
MTSVQETRAATAGIAAGPLAVIGGALLLAMGASQAQAAPCAYNANPDGNTWGGTGDYAITSLDNKFDNLCSVYVYTGESPNIDQNKTLNNYGDITNLAFMTIFMGTLDNKEADLFPGPLNGTVYAGIPGQQSDGVFTNEVSGFIDNNQGMIENGGEFQNRGRIFNFSGNLNNDNLFENRGELFNTDSGRIENTGTFINKFIIPNGIINKSFIANEGSTFDNRTGAVLTNEAGAEIAQLAGTLNNRSDATFNNDGVYRSEISGGVVNEGQINNSGTFTIDVGTSVTGGGTYTQTGGALTVNGTMTQSSLAFNGGTIGGNGTITGDVTVSNGVIAPGNTPGVTSIVGSLDVTNMSTMKFELGGTAVGDGTTGYDQVDVTGIAIIGSDTIFEIEYFGGFAASAGDFFDLVVAESILLGAPLVNFTFPPDAGLAWGTSVVVSGLRTALRLTAQAIAVPPVSVVPLPASLPLLLAGVFAMGALRRFRLSAR